LAKDVLTKDSNWDAALLNVGWMLEAAVRDGLEQLGLKEHVFEGGAVDTSVGCRFGGSCGVCVLGSIVKVVLKDVVFVVGEVSGGSGGFTVNHFKCLNCCDVYGKVIG
jgi:hypothetical protein